MHRFPNNSIAAVFFCSIVLAATGCSGLHLQSTKPTDAAWQTLSPLPIAVSNNAVTGYAVAGEHYLFSFMGLSEAKTWQDITRQVWTWNSHDGGWSSLPPVPGEAGRLAAIAVTVGQQIYLFGGYTVAADGHEVSVPDSYQLGANDDFRYHPIAPMPVPVDDTVALVYQDRYVYLISGWHDLANVNLVQVYDTHTDHWTQATAYPGASVFGHAGGIVGNQLVVCDGVAIAYREPGQSRQFIPSDECWYGRIDAQDHRRIHWSPMPPHPGVARYRMAAVGVGQEQRVVFVGGSDNPYNYNGIGYNTLPAQPSREVFSFDLQQWRWSCHGPAEQPTMDHRGLVALDQWLYLIGGMQTEQKVSKQVYRFHLPAARSCTRY